jgi:hypothetical protein
LQITRYPSLSEPQFQGCISAFVDALSGELNAAAMYLRKLENQPKGAAFAFEMSLDTHRYGALLVLDRWATMIDAFGAGAALEHNRDLIEQAPARVQTAENILGRANALVDAAEQYTPELINACVMAYHALNTTFAAERNAAERFAQLGALLPEDYRQARRIFLEDLAAR